MSKSMPIKQLKKELMQLQQNELIELVTNLYKKSKKVEEIVNAKFIGKDYVSELLEDYKGKMYDIFFPNKLTTLPSLKAAKKLISDFKVVGDEIAVLDLMLYYVECGNDFTNTFGDINESFYDSLCSVYEKFVDRLNLQSSDFAYLRFEPRINNLINSSSHIGWGYGDYIYDKSYEIEWLKEE